MMIKNIKFGNLKNLALAGFIGACSVGVSQGTVIVSKSLTNTPGADFSGWNSVVGSQEMIDFFVTTSASSVQTVNWIGFYHAAAAPIPTSNFEIRIYDVIAGARSNLIYTSDVSVTGVLNGAVNNVGFQMYDYSTSIVGGPALNLGTTYAIGIMEDDASTPTNWAWSHNSTGITTSTNDFPGSTPTNTGLAYSLVGVVPVPEPSSALLASAGLCLLVLRRKRK